MPTIKIGTESSQTTPQLKAAFRKGASAFKNGIPRSGCPYGDSRTMRGSVTWSRSFLRAWIDGWEWEKSEQGA